MDGGHEADEGNSGVQAVSTPPPIEPGLLGWIDQSPTLATVLGGLILAAILYGLSFVPKFKPAYKVIAQGIALFFKWVWSWRVNGKVKRDSLVQQGYDKRDAEVKAERARSPRPSWRISTDTPFGEDVYFLNNSGWRVSDVRLDADPEFFTFDGEAFFPGAFGDNNSGGSTGRQIRGEPTDRGRREGVTFTVAWIDQNGDEQPKTAGGDLPGTVALLPKPLKPVIPPTWQIGKPKSTGDKDIYVLANGAPGSVTNNVVIDAGPEYFTFMVKKDLGDLVGPGYLPFAGRPTDGGIAFGVTFWVTYEDANGDRHTDDVLGKFGFNF